MTYLVPYTAGPIWLGTSGRWSVVQVMLLGITDDIPALIKHYPSRKHIYHTIFILNVAICQQVINHILCLLFYIRGPKNDHLSRGPLSFHLKEAKRETTLEMMMFFLYIHKTWLCYALECKPWLNWTNSLAKPTCLYFCTAAILNVADFSSSST